MTVSEKEARDRVRRKATRRQVTARIVQGLGGYAGGDAEYGVVQAPITSGGNERSPAVTKGVRR